MGQAHHPPPHAAPAPAQPTARKGGAFKLLVVLGIGAMGLFACLLVAAGLAGGLWWYTTKYKAGGSFAGGTPLREGTAGIPAPVANAKPGQTEKAALGKEQKLIRELFGRPPAFSIIFGDGPKTKKPIRFETWTYPRLAANFMFRNGTYADSTDVPRGRARLRAKTARPEQFNASLTLEQIQAMVGSEPLFQLDIPAGRGKATAFHFESGLVAGFDQETGKLAYVQQLTERRKR